MGPVGVGGRALGYHRCWWRPLVVCCSGMWGRGRVLRTKVCRTDLARSAGWTCRVVHAGAWARYQPLVCLVCLWTGNAGVGRPGVCVCVLIGGGEWGLGECTSALSDPTAIA